MTDAIASPSVSAATDEIFLNAKGIFWNTETQSFLFKREDEKNMFSKHRDTETENIFRIAKTENIFFKTKRIINLCVFASVAFK